MNMEVTLGLPHYALTLLFFSLPGHGFFSWEEAVDVLVALVGLLVIGYGFPYMTWKWLMYRGTPETK